jgi:hypothetical protein
VNSGRSSKTLLLALAFALLATGISPAATGRTGSVGSIGPGSPVPKPSSLLLVGSGLIGVWVPQAKALAAVFSVVNYELRTGHYPTNEFI